ncbi:MAG: taurine catabolism dioxygenase TauD [Gammaproteobacteria bacterium RIFOXYA12_FULL_61_12]|nr:MAG: taurine catabolism dioxygenase TauD [Gammaproteobacteria bacterium RIFOXYD12_FULL_61_37]OGT92002.1 MAG: taurine catabolism dioxygenase TauD [Gammaproteobacteria bacterium RIFOXYA12_FULL_61_12]
MISETSPFNLSNTDAYLSWRDAKLEAYPTRIEDLVVEIKDPRQLTPAERGAVMERVRKTNMAVYVSDTVGEEDKEISHRLGAQFGLTRLWLDPNRLADDDGITSLRVREDDQIRTLYIPYTNLQIHWHTDGYYNEPDKQIGGLNLHCVRPAKEGGENALMDHEMAYILLRDADPGYISAFMAQDAMTIPLNDQHGFDRPDRPGPVFSVHPEKGYLHMRYTARKRNILWKDDEETRRALNALETLLAGDTPYIYRATLQPGMGLISNNILHDRSGFNDDPAFPRLLYRARFYDRIGGT